MNKPFTEWETPYDLFQELNEEFNFDLDVCASHENAKCEKYLTKDIDALNLKWFGTCWMNPPYDKNIGCWIQKAYKTSQEGCTVVCLIQGRSSDTKWWHEFVMKASELRFIKGRLYFGKNKKFTKANISNVLIIFLPYCKGPPKTISIDTKGRILNKCASKS